MALLQENYGHLAIARSLISFLASREKYVCPEVGRSEEFQTRYELNWSTTHVIVLIDWMGTVMFFASLPAFFLSTFGLYTYC